MLNKPEIDQEIQKELTQALKDLEKGDLKA